MARALSPSPRATLEAGPVDWDGDGWRTSARSPGRRPRDELANAWRHGWHVLDGGDGFGHLGGAASPDLGSGTWIRARDGGAARRRPRAADGVLACWRAGVLVGRGGRGFLVGCGCRLGAARARSTAEVFQAEAAARGGLLSRLVWLGLRRASAGQRRVAAQI
ncbi:hypothetical protein ZWY2020_003397 [Hordeum vulgare]|nr:hypothetical protein ZWY2020_003397 [Hordeum vulgare]